MQQSYQNRHLIQILHKFMHSSYINCINSVKTRIYLISRFKINTNALNKEEGVSVNIHSNRCLCLLYVFVCQGEFPLVQCIRFFSKKIHGKTLILDLGSNIYHFRKFRQYLRIKTQNIV